MKILNNSFIKFVLWLFRLAIWVFVIFIVLLIAIQRFFDNKVSIGSYRMFTIVSGSMLPEYEVYDVIIVKEVGVNSINVGDDIAYLGKADGYDGKIITHRVVSKREDNGKYYFVTQGTQNNVADPEISGSQVYGKVYYKPVVLSFLSHILNNSYGLYFLIIVPTAFLIFLEILDRIKEKESKLDE